jgi:hypothetical protein
MKAPNTRAASIRQTALRQRERVKAARPPLVSGGEARPSKARGVRHEDCTVWSECLRYASDVDWPAMSCEGCAGPFAEIAPPHLIPAPIAAPSKSTTQLSGATQGEAMANHDKDTSARDLAAALKCGVSSIYRSAERLNLPVAGRTAEQHMKLIAEVLERRRASGSGNGAPHRVASSATPAKPRKAPTPKLAKVVAEAEGSAFFAMVQAVVGVTQALHALPPEQRTKALNIASACLEAGN